MAQTVEKFKEDLGRLSATMQQRTTQKLQENMKKQAMRQKMRLLFWVWDLGSLSIFLVINHVKWWRQISKVPVFVKFRIKRLSKGKFHFSHRVKVNQIKDQDFNSKDQINRERQYNNSNNKTIKTSQLE